VIAFHDGVRIPPAVVASIGGAFVDDARVSDAMVGGPVFDVRGSTTANRQPGQRT
jgi:hypothetical protein